MEQMECVVLRNVEQRGVTSALRTLVVADEVTFSDPSHDPVPAPMNL